MISIDKLYRSTNGGLWILELHFPGITECIKKNQPFKMRPEEKTASARAKMYNGVWKVTDFGVDSKAMSPIDVHMERTGLRLSEAILDLATRFNITDDLNRQVNKPDIRKVPAEADQIERSCFWEFADEFTKYQCEIMGPHVTSDTLQSLHWYPVKFIAHVKDREVIYKYSTETYPIFMRECWFEDSEGKRDRFYKVYEPLNPEKRFRFSTQPANKKPASYINGLEELAASYTKFNEQERANWERDPANENKPYKDQKLDRAFICSGERDALCVRALGEHPIWFNSETYRVTNEEYRKIMRYVEILYNIPDIDSTGRIKGSELALRFIDIHTIWLPEALRSYRDNRGRPRKDFRDWVEIYDTKSDFNELVELATPAKFWTMQLIKDKDRDGTPRRLRYKYSIDVSCLYEFLMLNGFYTLRDKHAPQTRFVQVIRNIVKVVTAKEIRDFVHQWTRQTGRPRELRNLVLTTPALSQTNLDSLTEIDPDFTNYTEHSQYFYFPKFAIEVSGSEMTKYDLRTSALDRYVWEDRVIPHNIDILPDMFEITHPEGMDDSEFFDISIKNNTSNYFRYLINSSRIFWRKELEQSLENMTPEEADRYRADHKYDIAGPHLSPGEIQEQKQCLINKIFTIGFMLHRYKSESRAWAPFLMDNVIGDNDQCNGRSGKSFMLRALSHFTNWLKISGRNPKILENQFCFEQISKATDIVVVDDCDEYLPFRQFYDNITSEITINTKNVSAYNLPYSDAPKFAFTTNYVPKDFDGSSRGRMIFVVFSDYYHQSTEDNDYNETRSIRDDFNKDLFGSAYTEAEWEADINFMLQCVKFYLSIATKQIKIEPKIANIIYRKYLRDMSDNFRDWAEGYFAEDSDRLDTLIVREEAFKNYTEFSRAYKTTMQRFSTQLTGFCYTCDWIAELNPQEFHNSNGRIMKRVEVDPVTHKKELKQMIYIRSCKAADAIAKSSGSEVPRQIIKNKIATT